MHSVHRPAIQGHPARLENVANADAAPLTMITA